MFILCLIAMIVSIAAGFFAARIAAGSCMTIRKGVFNKVISFSNTEMGQILYSIIDNKKYK